MTPAWLPMSPSMMTTRRRMTMLTTPSNWTLVAGGDPFPLHHHRRPALPPAMSVEREYSAATQELS